MLFSSPIPFQDALDSRKVKALLPTALSSAELAKIEPQILERSLFSARTTSAEYLQTVGDNLDEILAGKTDFATSRLDLKKRLGEIGYAPEGVGGGITDLSSDKRINLVLEMNTNFARGYGQWAQTQDEDVLDQFPCQELYRLEARKEPRDWLSRWRGAGGELFEGRMVAKVNDGIWTEISAFGIPYPPFDYNSGMWTRLVSRDEAIDLGMFPGGRGMIQTPESRGLNDLLTMSPDIRARALISALVEVGYKFVEGVLSF